ncbi:hypothetical protein OH76DRAFT_553784 [Lentinus brumalis]|uniref:Uncharacterized protein n=1 Tax=Lentinus brumalis TaxID=2498619 RepID=A0A371D974_9APHY|nr:hypothetical protein OH76DRAFT_553784 [Polyporus brumalis]
MNVIDLRDPPVSGDKEICFRRVASAYSPRRAASSGRRCPSLQSPRPILYAPMNYSRGTPTRTLASSKQPTFTRVRGWCASRPTSGLPRKDFRIPPPKPVHVRVLPCRSLRASVRVAPAGYATLRVDLLDRSRGHCGCTCYLLAYPSIPSRARTTARACLSRILRRFLYSCAPCRSAYRSTPLAIVHSTSPSRSLGTHPRCITRHIRIVISITPLLRPSLLAPLMCCYYMLCAGVIPHAPYVLGASE